MIKLQNPKGGYILNVPTSKKDLDFNSIKDVVANVIPSKHYAVIALCQSFKPFNLAMLANGKDTDVKVSTYFIKANEDESQFKASAGDKVIVSRSDLELSVHLNANFSLSANSITKVVEDSKEIRDELRNGICDENGILVEEIIAVEFKLIPVNAIKAVICNDIPKLDRYIHSMAVRS
ncbi:hypothetical protein [Clostridium sp.]|uniref:hypothetical protein n=1 Tax=Clostridium sp. TaxID=1506 RepID=UPI0025C2897E|nr:hypothetical protein [Clostridium sp.]